MIDALIEILFKNGTKKDVYALLISGVVFAGMAAVGLLTGQDLNGIDPMFFLVLGIIIITYGILAMSFYEDCKKMNLDFYIPNKEEDEKIVEKCAMLKYIYTKEKRVVALFYVFMIVFYLGFSARYYLLLEFFYLHNFLMDIITFAILPGLVAMIPTYFIWNAIYNKRIAQIINGEYLVAEAIIVKTLQVKQASRKNIYYKYYVVLEDDIGNRGRFLIPEYIYYDMNEGNSAYIVKLNKGWAFYNEMEPIARQ